MLMCLITLCTCNVCGIFGAFATSFGPSNNFYSGKYKVVMDSPLLSAYSVNSFGKLIVHFSDVASLKTTFFTAPPAPSMGPFPW